MNLSHAKDGTGRPARDDPDDGWSVMNLIKVDSREDTQYHLLFSLYGHMAILKSKNGIPRHRSPWLCALLHDRNRVLHDATGSARLNLVFKH